ncbi:type I-C CRISPR-associated protein Cas7/Csd2 [Ferrimonas kyonanensis]|uniref:type I-C CRISPR-associated protein Cas7/Csd2 n=1 Tax=Ferrimonas kyonanensis TaxID=364763 RepID=UPI0004268CD4|nr:type I-C CRISPR-associated protein Cas7/Csd2 [Ferrimonas kyonanensis]
MELQNRYDFVLLFDVKDGNPNGDPDAGNLPRLDAETGQGLVTDVCLKRKVRNFVELVKSDEPGHQIYVKEKAVLNQQHERAYVEIGAEELLKGDKKRKGGDKVAEARQWMCKNFFDVRSFGAVMSTGVNCGQVRGPIQLTFSRSVDPIVSSEHSITRMAVATEKEALAQEGDNRTMGRKFTVPYGLYRCHGFISSHLAKQTGFNEQDLELFFTALEQMFDHDRSASRGEMAPRALLVFKHNNELGNAPAHSLFDRVSVTRSSDGPARSIGDYQLNIDESNWPAGVELYQRLLF